MNTWRTRELFLLAAITISGCAANHGPETPTDHPEVIRASMPRMDPVPATGQPTFATPEEAAGALKAAAESGRLEDVAVLTGLPTEQLTQDGAATGTQELGALAASMGEYLNVVRGSDMSAQLFIGKENYPFCIPVAEHEGKWFFDAVGGMHELRVRTIGDNELNTIGVCGAYAQAQAEYYSEDRDADDVLEYSTRLASSAGGRDGLYWPTAPDESPSPFGEFVAQAWFDHPAGAETGSAPSAYHGYFFRILTSQGPNAPGGRYSYLINGNMVAGFALVAYPAEWGQSGVMTFMVGPNGRIFQKDLGESSEQAAREMIEFNPDQSWELVREE